MKYYNLARFLSRIKIIEWLTLNLGKEWRSGTIHTYDAMGQLQKPPFQTKCFCCFGIVHSKIPTIPPILFTYMYLKNQLNVGRYTSQIGSYGSQKMSQKVRSWHAFHRSRMVSWMLGKCGVSVQKFVKGSMAMATFPEVWWFTRWWFQICFIFTLTWGRFPFWLIFFKWVSSTTN